VSAVSYHPLSPAVLADPYPTYAELRADAPVSRVEDLDLWVVSRHADVRRVLHDARTFSSAAMAAAVARPMEYGDEPHTLEDPVSIIGTDGPTHARLRGLLNRGFTPRRIGALEPRIREIARGLLDDMVAAGPVVELQCAYAIPLPVIVIAELLGVGTDRRADFRRWSEAMVLGVFEQPDAAEQQDVARCGREMGEWLDGVIADRIAHPGPDLISALLAAEHEGSALSHDELVVFVFTLLVAGSSTTTYLIGNGVLALFDAPECREAVGTDPAVIPGLVEEVLRWDAPTQLMLRTALSDVEIAGTTIPAGATVAALLGSANRDEAVFAEPDRLDPRRDTRDHLAFGHGAHYCLGAALARLEARVAFEELLGRAAALEPTGAARRVESLVFRGPVSLPVRLG
jgi:cytochrome P450